MYTSLKMKQRQMQKEYLFLHLYREPYAVKIGIVAINVFGSSLK